MTHIRSATPPVATNWEQWHADRDEEIRRDERERSALLLAAWFDALDMPLFCSDRPDMLSVLCRDDVPVPVDVDKLRHEARVAERERVAHGVEYWAAVYKVSGLARQQLGRLLAGEQLVPRVGLVFEESAP